jgi:Amt family ammonium transporter
MPPEFSAGDTAWVLAASALVLLMTPGLAFFYGGMVRAKSALNMLIMSFICIAVISVLWVLYGYALAFGTDAFHGLIGNLDHVGLRDIEIDTLSGSIPTFVFVSFQLMFAIITPALISGAIADRAKFTAWTAFVVLWATFVYFPIAHWVFFFDGGNGGWIADRLQAFDFAGGTAVHINAGCGGLALALVLGKRVGFQRDPMRPHNLPLVMLGSGLLWFGWFGFNSGSALTASGLAALAFLNTQVATAAAVLGWLLVEKVRDGKPTTLGAASGAVAGLVAITPACGTVSPLGSIVVGGLAGIGCALAIGLKYRLGYDDSLDVVGVHLVGGLIGTLLIGFLATGAKGLQAGLFYGGGFSQLGKQAIAAFAVLGYSLTVSLILGYIVHKTIGFRVSEDEEVSGIDLVEHAETAYDFGPLVSGSSARPLATAAASPATSATGAPDSERVDA